jgi:hypothetical protein
VTKFLKSATIIGFFIIIADWALGTGFKYLYSRQRSGLLYRTSYAIDSTKAQYLVLGASRANHHYDPRIIEAVLKSTFYNCGRDKQGIIYSCAVLSAALKRYTPKEVIIEIRPDEFICSDEGTLTSLLPYYKNNAIRPYLQYNSKFQSVKLLSSIYPYNSLFTNLLAGLNPKSYEDYKGYVKKNNTNKERDISSLKENGAVDSVKVKVFNQFLDKLDKQHLHVLLVISPLRYHYTNSITTNICTMASQKFKGITFVNYANKPEWMNERYYSDNYHLNSKGAAIFSKEIANFIVSSAAKIVANNKTDHQIKGNY